MDRKLVKDFTDAVKKLARFYDEIKGLIDKEAAAIKQGNAKKTEAVIEKKEKVINSISAAGRELSGIFKKLSKAAGYQEDEKAAISDVLLKLDKEDSAAVEKALAALSEAVSGAAGPNAQNAYLLKNRLQFTGFSEAARRKIEHPEHTVYGRDGAKKTEKRGDKLKVDREI